MVSVDRFLEYVDQIADEKPSYKLGHDGTGGKCDCIGLIIGAIRRADGKWPGIHGSNYAARNEMRTLDAISGKDDLTVGEVVYKAKSTGDIGYSLPSRYKSSADRLDYYHVGVVRSVSPLKIVHCTSPGIVVDKKLGKWAHHGQLSRVDYSGTGDTEQSGKEETREDVAKPMQTAIVTADTGNTVNLRKSASTASTVLAKVPVGTNVEISTESGKWTMVTYGGKTGWMQSKYLVSSDQQGSAETNENIMARLDDVERRLSALEAWKNMASQTTEVH